MWNLKLIQKQSFEFGNNKYQTWLDVVIVLVPVNEHNTQAHDILVLAHKNNN